MKTRFRPILAAKSLTIRLLHLLKGSPPSRGSERLTDKELRLDDRKASPWWAVRPRHPLAEDRSNRYSASGPEGGGSSTTHQSWPH